MVTTDTILDTMRGYVESKVPIAPTTWLDAGIKLVALMSEDTDKLIELQLDMAQLRVSLLDIKPIQMSATEVRMRVESHPTYALMKKQEAKVKRINEFIMMSKKYATIRSTEYGNS
mgnify:CR=1 FL=1